MQQDGPGGLNLFATDQDNYINGETARGRQLAGAVLNTPGWASEDGSRARRVNGGERSAKAPLATVGGAGLRTGKGAGAFADESPYMWATFEGGPGGPYEKSARAWCHRRRGHRHPAASNGLVPPRAGRCGLS